MASLLHKPEHIIVSIGPWVMKTAQKLGRILLLMCFSGIILAKTGVVFVHGKGPATLAEPANAWDYWGMEFLNNATQDFSLPFFVAHYDGEVFMTDSARVVSKQILDFVKKEGVDKLVINTHSFGGVVVRYIMSNPLNDADYTAISKMTRWVTAIAAPQAGSESADLAEQLQNSITTGWVVDWINQDTASTKNVRTSDMEYYNKHFLLGTQGRPELPVPFYAVAGTGVWNDFVYSWHYEDFGLAFISTLTNFAVENDGVVSKKSAEAVGIKWTEIESNHHHSRRDDYVLIGKMLADGI